MIHIIMIPDYRIVIHLLVFKIRYNECYKKKNSIKPKKLKIEIAFIGP